MRRHGQLFEHFASFANLLSAYRKARRGTRRNGATAGYFFHLETELLGLQEELLQMRYQPGAYRYFKIYDPKERTISVAPFRDRVVHHALVQVLEPIYERIFIADSYATRKGKGTHVAIAQAQRYLHQTGWFLKADVDKYFDSIRHDILLALLERKVKDRRLLEITRRIVTNGGMNGCGLPIGNLTSQFFANVYLHPLDMFVRQALGTRRYVRYMDDFVLFSSDKKTLSAHRRSIEDFLQGQLALQLKPGATYLNSAANGLTFLGRRIFPTLVRFAAPNLRRITRRMAQLESALQKSELSEETFIQSMNSYWAILQYGGNAALRKCLLQERG